MDRQDRAFPTFRSGYDEVGILPDQNGLTKREYIAAHVMAALMVEDANGRLDALARRAVLGAEELLRVLKEGEPSQARPDVTTPERQPSAHWQDDDGLPD